MTRERWVEVARIVLTGAVALLYARGALPLPWLLMAVAFGVVVPVLFARWGADPGRGRLPGGDKP